MEQTVRKTQLLSFLFTSLAGTLLHFLFDWSGQFPLVGAVSAVNESVWEHMKLLYFPMLAATLAQHPILAHRYGNYLCVKLLGILSGLLLIPALHYTYTGALGIHLVWLDISIFYLSAAAAYLLETVFLLRSRPRRFPCILPALLIAALAILFLLFTFFPPQLPIFRDPVTFGYGIPHP